MTRKEIQAVYTCGPEAIIMLVQSLLVYLDKQKQQIQDQQAQIEALMAHVKELEDCLAKNSHNSNKPSSSDTNRSQPRGQRTASDKKPGGQPGHAGHTLRMSETPDQIVIHSPVQCGSCGRSLTKVAAQEYERRQIFELPILKLEVIEHRAEVKSCPRCQQVTKGMFPVGVNQPVQYGNRVKTLGVYLIEYQMLSYDRTSEFFSDVFGRVVQAATVHRAATTCYEGLAATEEAIKEGLRQVDVVHSDETGLYVAGKREWVHVTSTQELTHYAHHPNRGKAAIDSIDILPKFHGTTVHDGYSSYSQYTECNHALCNVHHLRELTFIEEQYEQPWAAKMKALLLEIKECVAQHQAAPTPPH